MKILVGPPDQWGGRAALDWLGRLARSGKHDPAAEELLRMPAAIDRIDGAAGLRL
ncbi:hypothetical protein [Devosia salina]|uniref:Uncharacterized protein n=1 Tax=Devosia salina TaxID=2860336 RepID=A0ABX8WAU9_9HYPH|nr:hypothetical protein [Devosia salina]QYO76090.1 hypothetical protein K1X15_15920 [Devosia salina]